MLSFVSDPNITNGEVGKLIKNLIILDNTFQPIGEILPGEYTNDRLTESLETGFFTKRFTIDKRKFADAEKLKKDTHLMTTDENGEKLLLSIFSIDNATEFEIDVTYEDFPVSFLQGEAKTLTAPSTGNKTYTTANSSGATQTTTTSSTSQPTAKQFDNSKATIATSPISTAGYTASKVNMFRVDQADPAHITGAYIDDFLRRGYPDSPIIGYGKDVKELSDYYGISAGAFLGVAAKETVFGRSSSGGRYNFTGITSGPGTFFDNIFPKKFAVDRQWIDPPTVRDGIAAFFHLARYNYVEKGFVQYDRFTERWAPSFENDTHSVKSMFWGVITSLGYSTTDTTYKTNKSKSTDNPNGLKINATSTQTIVTNQNQQIVTTSEDGELIPQELAFYLNESLDGTPIETGTLDTIELRAISYPKEKLATRIQNICKDFNLYPKYTTIFEDAKSYTPVSIRLDLVKRRGRLTDIRFDSDINLLSAQYSSNKNGLITGIDVIPHAENRTIETVQTQAVPTQAVEVVKSSEGNKTQKQLEYLKRQTGGTYTQSAARNNWSPEPVSADCSSMVYKSLIYAGIPCGYKKGDWLGTTYTLRDHARRGLYYDIVSASQPLEPGDIILCVNWGHVVTYIGNGEIFHASLWGQPHRKQKNNYGRGNMVLRPKDRGSQTVSKPSTTQTTKIGNSLQDQNWKWLKNEGATDVGASGIMGNISVESGFDPTRKQNGGGPGRGLVQWTVNERWVPVTNWIQSQGGDIYSVEWQIKAIKWELTNGWESTNMMNRVAQYGGTRKSNGWESFMSITNLEKSVMCFLEVYERAGIPHAARRVSEGQRVLKAYQGTYNGDSVTTASGNTTTTTNSVQKEVIYDISDIEYDDGDFYTHKGSNEIISREAQRLYGWNKRNLSHHKLGVHEMKSININAEFELALNELKERSQPKESYRIIIDAEDPATASTLRVLRIGDTLKIVSKNWANGQDLILEADVAELVRSDTNKELEAITITNYKRIYAKIPDRVLEIQQRINEREELFNKNLVLSLLADNAIFTNLSDSSSIEAKVSNVNEDLTGRLVDDDFYWQVFGSDGLPLTRDDEIDILGVDNIAEPGANYKRFRTLNVIEGAKYKINILEKGADFIIRAIHKDGFVIQESERFDDYENLIYEAPSFAQYLEVDVFESTTDKPIAVLTFPTLVDFNGKNITIPSDLINKSATVTLQVGESKTSINLSEADLSVVSAVPPENPKEGQRWIKKEVDGSHTIYVFKNGEWEKQVDQALVESIYHELGLAHDKAKELEDLADELDQKVIDFQERVGSDGNPQYNKNRSTISSAVSRGELIPIKHNGLGYVAGKDMVLSFKASCVPITQSQLTLNFTADTLLPEPTPITKSDVILNLIEPGGSVPIDPVDPTPPIEPSPIKFGNARVVNLSDYGGIGDGATDNFDAFKRVIDASVNEPLVLQIDDGHYFVEGITNSRLEPWPLKSKGLRIEGTGNNVNIYHKNNRTNNRHEYYFMQLIMTEDSLGFEAENFTLNGIRNPQEELFYTQSESNPITNIPMARGISVDGAHHVMFNNVRFKNMYGGYAIQLQEYRDVSITNTTYDKVGGNDIQESFGMAIYLGGHSGDAVVEIDNAQAQGVVTDKDLRLSWIGVVLENGSIQSKSSSAWLRDKNTTVRITNSSFLDYHSTFHTESMAGNVYWNVDNVTARGSNYNIVAGVYGEFKEVSNRITMDVLPYGRLWGIVKGLYYSEPQEKEDNWNGHNKLEMYNSVINFIKVAGFEDPPQAIAYGNNVMGRLYNTQLNNVPNRLVTNGSALLYNSEINLAQGNNATRATLMAGEFSDPSKQKVEFNNTNVNPYGSHKNVTFGPKPAEAKNTGFVAPWIELPIQPPI